MFTSTEGLLQTVRQRGWTSEDQRVFLQRYGPLLRRALLTELGRRFGPTALRGLSRYLKALEQGEASGPGEMSGAFWDLACDVWQAVCLEIFKAKGNTMTQYARYCDKSAQTGKAPMKFESFLWGLVNLKVRQQIPRHREIFAPVVSPAADDPEDGDPWEERLPSEHDLQVEELALADEIDLYWEGLLRCATPSSPEVERTLAPQEKKEHLLCWTCCSLKQKLPKRQRENLLAFVAFFVSQRGAQRAREPLPKREEISLATLSGRYLRWDEDIFQVFGKSIRKDRVLAQIREELLRSPYRDLIGVESESEADRGH